MWCDASCRSERVWALQRIGVTSGQRSTCDQSCATLANGTRLGAIKESMSKVPLVKSNHRKIMHLWI